MKMRIIHFKDMPDGLFPTEPIFVGVPDANEEDDGIILMSGVDGDNKKGFIMIYNATTMDLMYHELAPRTSLIGLHTKFYPFSVGCSVDDCTPDVVVTTTMKTTTTTTSSSIKLFPNVFGFISIVLIACNLF